MAYVMAISKPGDDVKTVADKQKVFSTKYQGLKIVKHDTRSTAGSVAHGLGYTPAFMNFYNDGTGKYRIDNLYYRSTVNTYTNGTNIVFAGTNNYYFIFANKLE